MTFVRSAGAVPFGNDDYDALLEEIEQTPQSVFVCGRAGTGKSTLLRELKIRTRKNAAVLAPTGVAALNVGGQTIHSFFQFPPRFIDRSLIRRRNSDVLRALDLLIIDEISMVRADLMDGMDLALRKARGNPLPFGGVQLIFFGDLFQLPPVVRSPELQDFFQQHYGGPYFFQSNVFKEFSLRIVQLQTVYRQQDAGFIEILEHIRDNAVSDADLARLNRRVLSAERECSEQAVVLTTTNALAQRLNERRLAAFPRQSVHYQAKVTERFDSGFFPTDADLVLKPGAQVMLLNNDPDKRWVNGSLAQISRLERERVWVCISGQEYEVSPQRWERVEYVFSEESDSVQEQVVGTFEQYPVRLAWAMTIHKSQGNTFDHVVIDLGTGAFAHGQVYVALSRCRSLEGIYLTRAVTCRDIIFDPQVYEFQRHLVR